MHGVGFWRNEMLNHWLIIKAQLESLRSVGVPDYEDA
jgi:hypothetical protein